MMSPCKLPFALRRFCGILKNVAFFAPRFRQLIETLLDLRNEKCISCQEYLPQQVHTSAALMCDNTHELFRSLYSRISYFKMQISDSHDANNPQSFTSSNQPRILRFWFNRKRTQKILASVKWRLQHALRIQSVYFILRYRAVPPPQFHLKL